ncbi:MAG: pyridoxamine 5'-phosphate oxidase family protein, partial [Pseudomonadota bacterium]
MATDPEARFHSDRAAAFAAEDPNAALCTVASVDADGEPQARTLVLRNVEEQLALFINASSPKWSQFGRPFVVHTYWPST